MKRSILAARTQAAIQKIAAETERLGGRLSAPSLRGDVEHRHMALLEAIGESLAGIGAAAKPTEPVGEAAVTVETVTVAPPSPAPAEAEPEGNAAEALPSTAPVAVKPRGGKSKGGL